MAKFDFEKKCAHPKICLRLMREFVQDACDLLDEDGNPVPVEVKKGPLSCTFPYDAMSKVLILVDYDQHKKDKIAFREFNRNVKMRSEAAKGFSDLTLTLLHELGHNETIDDLPQDYDREKAYKMLLKCAKDDRRVMNLMYFSLPDEYAATEWAIDWLSDEDNRKRAKKFEKDFFKAWRGK